MKVFFSILILLGAANGCGSQNLSSEEMQARMQSMSGTYQVQDTEKMNTMDRDVHITFSGAENSISGNTGCNKFFGSFSVDGKSLQFEDMGQTKMYCEEYMEVERAFNNNIGRVSQYSFEDDKVLLKDEEGNTLLELKKKQQ